MNGLSSALSQTVANGMKTVIGDEASENVLFVEMMDRFFDRLNVNNFTTGHRKRKFFQYPYRKKDELLNFVLRYVHNIIFTWAPTLNSSILSQIQEEKDLLLNRKEQ